MPSNEQRRQAAKRKLERQLTRRAERAKRRRLIAVLSTVGGVVVVVGAIILVVNLGKGGSPAAAGNSTNPTTTPAKPAVTSKGPCKYATTPQQPAPQGKDVGLPEDPSPTPKSGTAVVTLKTNAGDIPVTLDRAQAPCTVQSMLHLVSKQYYDNTPCHRLTTYATPPLKVLQCGDPTGSGSGGPGYGIPDEKPTTLKPAPTTTPAPAGQPASVVYPAGTIAMANSGQPGSGGSQFFLVYADSQLPPNYTVFGTMSPAGLDVVKKIAAAGVTPGTDPQSGQPTTDDGKPKNAVTITQAVVTPAA